ncbi:MAG TPA: ABC-2 family transporter protein [Bacteriovoracaceae bacterium]|nr:ABC-2 family transporter protein [Bacteriovoracaceae bacterium]
MKRYLRLYLYFLRFSFSKALQFRLDFTFRIIMDIIYYVVNILFFKVIYLHTPMLAGWSEEQMMVFVASYLLVDAINMTIFSSNMWWIPFHINRGDLDYYLIRPVSPLFFLSLREFSANSFLNLLIAGGFFTYTLAMYSAPYNFLDLMLFIGMIINGTLIYYCIQMMMIIPVFWTHSARGFQDLFYSMGLAMERPDRIYKGWLRLVFTTVLPFALIASFPARIFIEKFEWTTIVHLFAVSLGLWIVMISFWKLGLRNYSSASS